MAIHGRRQGEARRAFYCSTTMANTQTNIVEWCSLVVERADKLREVVGPGGVPEAGVVMVLLCKTLPEFEELRLRLDYELGLDVPTVTKELMDLAKLRGITDIRGKYSSPRGARGRRRKTRKVQDVAFGGVSEHTPVLQKQLQPQNEEYLKRQAPISVTGGKTTDWMSLLTFLLLLTTLVRIVPSDPFTIAVQLRPSFSQFLTEAPNPKQQAVQPSLLQVSQVTFPRLTPASTWQEVPAIQSTSTWQEVPAIQSTSTWQEVPAMQSAQQETQNKFPRWRHQHRCSKRARCNQHQRSKRAWCTQYQRSTRARYSKSKKARRSKEARRSKKARRSKEARRSKGERFTRDVRKS